MGQQNLRTKKWDELGGRGSTTNIDLGDKGRGRILERLYDNTLGEKGQARAASVSKTIDVTQAAMNLLADVPVNTGIASDWLTFAQKLSSITGAPVDPKAAGTELYTSFVVPQIAEIIKLFGAGTGISDADRKAAESALALAKREPEMAKVALAYGLRGAIKESLAYNKLLEQGMAESEALGYNPEMFNNMIKYQIRLPETFGLPEDFMKPGALEAWTAKVIRPRQQRLEDAVKRNLGQPAGGVPY
jgi:hypothetical protein